MKKMIYYSPSVLAVLITLTVLLSCSNQYTTNGLADDNSTTCHNEDKKCHSADQYNQAYGVDVSWPIHHHQVSTNYLNLPHHIEPSKYPLPEEYQSMPIQPLGNKKSLYEKYMEGCIEHSKPQEEACISTEEYRIDSNLNQVPSQKNYTDTGYRIMKVPEPLWSLIKEFWNKNKDNQILENFQVGYSFLNHWEVPVNFVPVWNHSNVGGGLFLKRVIAKRVRDIVEQWTDTNVITTSVFGIRVYKEGAILSPHVDRPSLINSAIINIDQDLDEPWPLEVYGRDGKAVNITMQPGDMILYESHTLIHGRPFPFRGKFFANIFVHFEPYLEDHDDNTQQQDTVIESYTTDAHLAAREGHLSGLKSLLIQDSSSSNSNHHELLFQRDDNGWMPIHEACRQGHVHIVQFLLQSGANINEYTCIGDDAFGTTAIGGTPLYWALTVFSSHDPIVTFLQENGGLNVVPK